MNLGKYQGGVHECWHVSPYTKSANNVDSTIMVLLQDWTSGDSSRQEPDEDCIELGYTRSLPTNQNLIRFLKNHFKKELADVFATNLFPFIKPNAKGQYIPRDDLRRAAKEFGLPQIRMVRPKLVICLGLETFNAMREVCGEPRVHRLADAIDSPFSFEGIRIWCQAHTGRRGQNMRNAGRNRVEGDWRRMKRDVRGKVLALPFTPSGRRSA